MANVWVSVELDEVSTHELLDEFENRWLDDRERSRIIELIKSQEGRKLELFLSVQNKYSLLELEEMFNGVSTNQKVPKEQLELFA